MAEAVVKKVKVISAKYVLESESILIVGECEKGRLQHQIHKNCFTFGDKDPDHEMEVTAKLMEGKTITMAFDEDLEDKIKDNYPLKY